MADINSSILNNFIESSGAICDWRDEDMLRSGLVPGDVPGWMGVRERGISNFTGIDGDLSDGYAIPYMDLSGQPITDNGEPFIRFRLKNPFEFINKEGKVKQSGKYLSPKGSGVHIYIPRGTARWIMQEKADNTGTPLIITEGEKKAEILSKYGYVAIALPGVAMWRDAVSPGNNPTVIPVLPELLDIINAYRSRVGKLSLVVVVFDSNGFPRKLGRGKLPDGMTLVMSGSRMVQNRDVYTEATLLAKNISYGMQESVAVQCAWVPPDEDDMSISVGIDDYTQKYGLIALRDQIVDWMLKPKYALNNVRGKPQVEMTRDDCEALRRLTGVLADHPEIYCYGSAIVHIPDGASRIGYFQHELHAARLASNIRSFYQVDQNTGAHSIFNIPPRVSVAALSYPADGPDSPFRKVNSVTPHPVIYFGTNKTIKLSASNYDPNSFIFGGWDENEWDMPPSAAEITDEEFTRAALTMGELLGGVYVDTVADMSAAIALMLTAVNRAALRVAPGVLVSAPAPDSGKSYLGEVAEKLATPHDDSRMVLILNARADADAETTKQLTTALKSAAPVIRYDEVNGSSIDAPSLRTVISSDTFSARILGSQTDITLPTRKLFLVMANNVFPTNDSARRFMIVRLSPPPTGVSRGKVGPLDLLQEDRERYVRAALILIAGGAERLSEFRDGMPPGIGALSGFPEWSALCAGPAALATWEILNAVGAPESLLDKSTVAAVLNQHPLELCHPGLDPTATQRKLRDTDPERILASSLLRALWDFQNSYVSGTIDAQKLQHKGRQGFTADILVRHLSAQAMRRDQFRRDPHSGISPDEFILYEALLETGFSGDRVTNSRALGQLLIKYYKRTENCLTLDKLDMMSHKNTVVWTVTKMTEAEAGGLPDPTPPAGEDPDGAPPAGGDPEGAPPGSGGDDSSSSTDLPVSNAMALGGNTPAILPAAIGDELPTVVSGEALPDTSPEPEFDAEGRPSFSLEPADPSSAKVKKQKKPVDPSIKIASDKNKANSVLRMAADKARKTLHGDVTDGPGKLAVFMGPESADRALADLNDHAFEVSIDLETTSLTKWSMEKSLPTSTRIGTGETTTSYGRRIGRIESVAEIVGCMPHEVDITRIDMMTDEQVVLASKAKAAAAHTRPRARILSIGILRDGMPPNQYVFDLDLFDQGHEDVRTQLIRALGSKMWYGHNLSFDLAWLRGFVSDLRPAALIDTLLMTLTISPTFESLLEDRMLRIHTDPAYFLPDGDVDLPPGVLGGRPRTAGDTRWARERDWGRRILAMSPESLAAVKKTMDGRAAQKSRANKTSKNEDGDSRAVPLNLLSSALLNEPLTKAFQKPHNWMPSRLTVGHLDYCAGDITQPPRLARVLLGLPENAPLADVLVKLGIDAQGEQVITSEAIPGAAAWAAASDATCVLATAQHTGVPIGRAKVDAYIANKKEASRQAWIEKVLPLAPELTEFTEVYLDKLGKSAAFKASFMGVLQRLAPHVAHPMTDTGLPAMGADDILIAYKGTRAEELIQAISVASGLGKRAGMMQAYIDQASTCDKFRLHSLVTIAAMTLRTSSQDPNLQNVPNAKEVRALFEANPGNSIIAGDFSAVEMAVAAALSLRSWREFNDLLDDAERICRSGQSAYDIRTQWDKLISTRYTPFMAKIFGSPSQYSSTPTANSSLTDHLLHARETGDVNEFWPDNGTDSLIDKPINDDLLEPDEVASRDPAEEWSIYYRAVFARLIRQLIKNGAWQANGDRLNLVDVFRREIDPHLVTAFDVARNLVDMGDMGPVDFVGSRSSAEIKEYKAKFKGQRTAAKACNFGLLYSMQAQGLHAWGIATYGLDWSLDEADTQRSSWMNLFPEVPLWHFLTRMTRVKMRMRDTYAGGEGDGKLFMPTTLSGRPVASDKLPAALNYQDQGSAAEMAFLTMEEFRRVGLDKYLILFVHDEFVFEAPKDIAADMTKQIHQIMCQVGSKFLQEWDIPVSAEVEFGDYWIH